MEDQNEEEMMQFESQNDNSTAQLLLEPQPTQQDDFHYESFVQLIQSQPALDFNNINPLQQNPPNIPFSQLFISKSALIPNQLAELDRSGIRSLYKEVSEVFHNSALMPTFCGIFEQKRINPPISDFTQNPTEGGENL